MRALPEQFIFLCGAHMDQIMRLNAPSILGVSNPASIELAPGGAALNSASIAAGFGMTVTLLSPIGNDMQGEHLVRICKERGIIPALVPTSSHLTGLYSAIFEPDGDIVIGASDLKIYEVVDLPWLSTNLPRHSGLFLNGNLHEAQLQYACGMAAFVSAATISPAKAGRLSKILDQIDILFSNLGEARVLCGNETHSANDCANFLIDQGVAAGTISNGGKALTFWQNGDVFELPVMQPGHIVDVNGAGDVLAGTLLAAVAKGNEFSQAVEVAMKAATLSLTHNGPYAPFLFDQISMDTP